MLPPILKYLLTPILDDLDQIKVEEQTLEEGQTEYILTVPSDQMGFIIGKQGKTITSLRQILKAHGHATGKQIFIKLEEPNQETTS